MCVSNSPNMNVESQRLDFIYQSPAIVFWVAIAVWEAQREDKLALQCEALQAWRLVIIGQYHDNIVNQSALTLCSVFHRIDF